MQYSVAYIAAQHPAFFNELSMLLRTYTNNNIASKARYNTCGRCAVEFLKTLESPF